MQCKAGMLVVMEFPMSTKAETVYVPGRIVCLAGYFPYCTIKLALNAWVHPYERNRTVVLTTRDIPQFIDVHLNDSRLSLVATHELATAGPILRKLLPSPLCSMIEEYILFADFIGNNGKARG